ncbi:hypothetical protein F4776DRAFT_658807 [Hypoxylon sp. NC0597]|nr:hypothetical protein F4776DRAFT_658807 [Hypoxylon sp. NC0597]
MSNTIYTVKLRLPTDRQNEIRYYFHRPFASCGPPNRTPLLADSIFTTDATCGQFCVQQSDCTGTCSFCSTPAEYRWQCLDPSRSSRGVILYV